jgi:hypothetical protein
VIDRVVIDVHAIGDPNRRWKVEQQIDHGMYTAVSRPTSLPIEVLDIAVQIALLRHLLFDLLFADLRLLVLRLYASAGRGRQGLGRAE